MSTSTIEKLLPDNAYWRYFLQICRIPHPSGHEAALRDMLKEEAEKHHLKTRIDSAGNLAIDRPAAVGCEHYPRIILQAHLDMVPQAADGFEFDFLRDSIPVVVEGDWVTTGNRTTLGADDGMGIALAMELLCDESLKCGALRGVFTVAEETGLGGAENIDRSFLDADILLNLDSDRIYTIGCAGGSRFDGKIKWQSQAPSAGSQGIRIVLQGLCGGHSGEDIHRPVGSAAVELGDFLQNVQEIGFELASVRVGNLSNAIAREGVITAAIAPDKYENIIRLAEAYETILNSELQPGPDGRIVLQVEKLPAVPDLVLAPEAQTAMLDLWCQLPHGVLEQSDSGAVISSCNLAIVNGTAGKEWFFTLLSRSLYNHKRQKITDDTLNLMHKYGLTAAEESSYSSWEPQFDSGLLNMAMAIYRELYGSEAERYVTHGGLETGLFYGIKPDLQMISLAPLACGIHSPQERLSISDSEKVRQLLRRLLEKSCDLNM